MGLLSISNDTMISNNLLQKLIKENIIEIIFCGLEEQIDEFYIYPKDKQGKYKTKILVRNHIDGARDNSDMQHGPSIKVYDNERNVFVPVLLDLDKDNNIQLPKKVKDNKDNVSFIKSKSKILKRLLTNEADEYKKYWYADSSTEEGKNIMKAIEYDQINKYPK